VEIKIMSKKHFNVDKHEHEILDDFEKGKLKSAPNAKKAMSDAKKAAKNYIKRDTRINIRISSADLDMIRKIAVQEGLPYQTLLASVIHKFASGRLIDRGIF
jgi:predicted DNA binding CopG/RHH family protein